jgi:hypothetical protein
MFAPLLNSNGLPADSAWLFPEHDFSIMTPERFAAVVIERVLERGSVAQVRWLVQHYGARRIAAWVRRSGCRRLSRKTFEYWRWVFGIKRYRQPPWGFAENRS